MGWTQGFVPAADSQKLALCPEHDNSENRLSLRKAWHTLLTKNISTAINIARQKTSPDIQIISVHFMEGGSISFPCIACTPTEHESLFIQAPDGAKTYIPLRHIRDYTLRPSLPEEKELD
jgi:hypothetical protein